MMNDQNGLADVIAATAAGGDPGMQAMQAPAMQPPQSGDGKMIDRTDPDPHDARKHLVARIIEDVKADKVHWGPRFKMVPQDARFASGIQWDGAKDMNNGGRYIANVVLRHINGKVAALYAKNPKAVATRRKRLEYAIWDGSKAMLDSAQQQMMLSGQTGVPPDPQTMALIQDIAAGMAEKARLDRIARTLEVVHDHQQNNQIVPFKRSMKALVRRVVTVGWAWVKIDYKRELGGKSPDVQSKIADITERLATIERMSADLHDGEFAHDDAEAEKLRLALKQLQSEPDVLVSEGLVYSFPAPTSIIPDKRCSQLQGFVGADWVTEEFLLTPDEVKEIYKVDLGKNYTRYNENGIERGKVSVPSSGPRKETERDDRCMVWVTSNAKEGLVYTTCDGYQDFLEEPRGPSVKLDRFWQIFPLTFNDAEPAEGCADGTDVFPPSDVRMLMPIQKEYNRSRNGLREHRKANRPKTGVAQGMLSDDDKGKLASHPANAVIELMGLQPGQKVEDLLQPIKGAPIDAALYDTNFLMEDMMRVVGSQEANIGGTSGATATESSIAEGSRVSALSSNTDDLDDMLTELARAAGQILLMELSVEKAKEIAGPGAAWPELTRQELANEVLLEIVAGSSGRPNKDKEVASLERLLPFMLQIQGIAPTWLLKQIVNRLDDRIDPEDAMLSGMPSIQALNALAAKAAQAGAMGGGAGGGAGGQTPNGGGAAPTGDGTTAPAQQGAQGAQNAPAAPSAGGMPMSAGAQPNVDGRLGGAAPFITA